MEPNQSPRKPRFTTSVVVAVIVVSLLAGGLIGHSTNALANSGSISALESQVSTLQQQVPNLESSQGSAGSNNIFVIGDNATIAQLYAQVKDSVVVIRGLTVQYDIFHRAYYSQVQGSGFITDSTGKTVVVTNYHVVQDTINVTVTFSNGNAYEANVLGADPYADLAILSTTAPDIEYKSLVIADSLTLQVGDSLIAVGSPYGLAGSMTTGIVSALGRTITEDLTSGYPIANVIQTSTPINPGNSGGPLLNFQGQVIGITTAIVSNSEGLGFAIPSSTILREIGTLISKGSYNQHPWIGAAGTDMTYEIAKAMNIDVTYGWLITQVTAGGPADNAGLKAGTTQTAVAGQMVLLGGDIITAFNGTRIRDMDDLSTYLETNTLPGQVITVTFVRNGSVQTTSLTVGTRPAPS